MYEYSYPRVVESGCNMGSGTWLPALVGGFIGYFFGRGGNGCGNGWGNGGGCNGNGQTQFQQGEYTGESRAADNYIAQELNGLRNQVTAMEMSAKDQRIADLTAKTQALETRQLIIETTGPLSCQLGQVNRTLDSVSTGCGFKTYPGCSRNNCGF